MRLLAIETSTEHCSVALSNGNDLHSHAELAGQKHSEILLSRIEQLLNESGCALGDLEGIAFGAGPGSFTGVRIAASVAQGLAFGLNIPVLPVCTLEALAESSGRDHVACALDARLDEVYFAAYERRGENWHPILEPCLSAIGELAQLPGDGWVGVGSGFAILDAELAKHLRLEQTDATRYPLADHVARIGARMLASGHGLNPTDAQPIYLRNKVAMTTAERRERGYK